MEAFMQRLRRFAFALGLVGISLTARAATTDQIAATVDTTLTTAYTPPPAGQLRGADMPPVPIKQFAFDGDPNTYFGSSQNPTAKDHFTLVFDKPVMVKSISVTTGKPDGGD